MMNPFDVQQMMSNLDADLSLVHLLIDTFVGSADGEIELVRKAIRTSDPREAAEALHSLKGAIAIFAAHELLDEAAGLELLAKQGRLDAVSARAESFLGGVSHLVEALRKYQQVSSG